MDISLNSLQNAFLTFCFNLCYIVVVRLCLSIWGNIFVITNGNYSHFFCFFFFVLVFLSGLSNKGDRQQLNIITVFKIRGYSFRPYTHVHERANIRATANVGGPLIRNCLCHFITVTVSIRRGTLFNGSLHETEDKNFRERICLTLAKYTFTIPR